MSYILDALRRADAERSRGAVPGLHAQNMPGDGAPAARGVSPAVWVAGAAGMLVVAGALLFAVGPWRAFAPASEARVAPAPLAQGELPPPQPGAIDPGARPIEPPLGRGNPLPAYPPPPRAPQTAAPSPRPSAREALADRAAEGRIATLEPKAAKAQPSVEHYGAPIAPATATAPARAAAVPNINDLPPNVRSQLPRLAVGGAIYSDTPAARMVILNGQVFHEGDKPAADTVLEQIRLKSAVLNFRGQRYEILF
jgi:general secretion pathway protein B